MKRLVSSTFPGLTKLLFVVLLFGACTSHAQVTQTRDGKKYILHTVEKGQTLFAIGQRYAVPTETIVKANPAAGQGLSIGQVLVIPVDGVSKKEAKTAPLLRNGELVHVVQKKETVFGIAHKYNVSDSDLLGRNPQMADGLKVGMELVVPVAKVTGTAANVVAPAADDGSKSHLVQPKETVFGLCQLYAISEEELKAANGGLADGLKVGMYLRIPAKAVAVVPTVPVIGMDKRERYNVGLLLPFSLARNDSALARAGADDWYELTGIASQFYAGAQLAIDSLEHLGLKADIRVKDVGGEAAVWKSALKDPDLKNLDLYIGPFHRGAIEDVAGIAGRGHVVCPVPQSNKVLLGRPQVSKVVSGRTEHVQHIARYVARYHGNDNIILLRASITGEKELQDQMERMLREALAAAGSSCIIDSTTIAYAGKRDAAAIEARLLPGKLNVIVAPTEDVELVTTLVNKLAIAADKSKIIVFGLEQWQNMESLDEAKLDAIGLHLPASTWIDRNDPRVVAFERSFRERFRTDAGEYAFLGFDVTFFYLSALMEEGRTFADRYGTVLTRPLHMEFRMQKAGAENGYRNENVIMLRHQDLGLVIAKP
ncbi:MAG: LysM peptidoglycan-binding domain-containing protein [Flavobacteriales bacterium]